MAPVWVRHELKLLIVFHEFIHQHLCIIKMDVVIACTVDVQQISFQVLCISDGRTFHIVINIQSHVSLFIDVVVRDPRCMAEGILRFHNKAPGNR